MAVKKVLGYLTRWNEEYRRHELLIFHHPVAKPNEAEVVRGTVENPTDLTAELIREMQEEAGLDSFQTIELFANNTGLFPKDIDIPEKEQQEHFAYHLIPSETLPDNWIHKVTGTGDDCGHHFSFSWIPLDEAEKNMTVQTGYLVPGLRSFLKKQ